MAWRGALPFSDADTGRSSAAPWCVPRPSDEGKEKSGFSLRAAPHVEGAVGDLGHIHVGGAEQL